MTVALMGTCFLLGAELLSEDDPVGTGRGTSRSSVKFGDGGRAPPVRSPDPAPRAPAPPPVTAPPPVAPPVAPPPRRDLRPLPEGSLPPPGRERPPVRETEAVLRASHHVTALAQAPSLGDRIRIVDDLLATLQEDAAVETIRGLLDSELPGDFYEAETLRLRLLARLGDFRTPRSDRLLVDRLDPEMPRPQRLLALEMLALRPNAGRGEVQQIAQHDHDTVVQERARWAMTRWGS